MLQQIADANKNVTRPPPIYRKPAKLASRITGADVPGECSGPGTPPPNTESSGSRVREKRRTCRVGIFGRPLGTRTSEVIRQGASSKKGERTLLLDCGRRSRQVA